MNMQIVFRCDASVQIGSGHVMRCLTLANALRERGTQATIICREHPGHLFSLIEDTGHRLIALPPPVATTMEGRLAHSAWLGTSQAEDAEQVIAALKSIGHVDWLVVDHYALDSEWESRMHGHVARIMVIDDLADRRHDCYLLLDQNFYADMETRYDGLVPDDCVRLLGPKYALLRTEFRKVREQLRQRNGSIRRIFVFFGGSDLTNETAKALEAIKQLDRPEIGVDVVVGAANPHQDAIATLCDSMPEARLHVQVSNMAELMGSVDLAIGAGGSTTWERCAVGLPAIVLSLAENQVAIAVGTDEAGVLEYLGNCRDVSAERLTSEVKHFMENPNRLTAMSETARELIDSKGSERVCRALEGCA